MKLVRFTLEQIDGVAFYPLISLIIFFSIFSLMLFWVFRADKSYIDSISAMPLDDADAKYIKRNDPTDL